MNTPHVNISGTPYELPETERLGELRLIERVTGVTHREWRNRMHDQSRRLLEADEQGLDDEHLFALLDDLVMLGRIAQAVQRKHPEWSTDRVARFVDELNADDVQLEGGEPDSPPVVAEQETRSESGSSSAPPLSSDSDTDSNESENQQTSGTPTSPTSPAEPSEPAT